VLPLIRDAIVYTFSPRGAEARWVIVPAHPVSGDFLGRRRLSVACCFQNSSRLSRARSFDESPRTARITTRGPASMRARRGREGVGGRRVGGERSRRARVCLLLPLVKKRAVAFVNYENLEKGSDISSRVLSLRGDNKTVLLARAPAEPRLGN
jgi:hypothetical protein